MNRKNIPLILMLVAGAVTCVINLINKFSVLKQTASLLFVLVIFYFLGCVLTWTLDYFDGQNNKKKQEENGENDTEDKDGQEKTVEDIDDKDGKNERQ